jgi:hypothetical protein
MSSIDRLRRRGTVAILLLAFVLAGCTAYAPESDPYRQTNRALRGERAIVELRGGEIAVGVHHVRMAEGETTWMDDDGVHGAPTEDVHRVIVVTRRVPHWGWWVLAGLGLSLALDDELPFEIALDLALDAFVWGGEVAPSTGRVVFP